MADRAQQVQSRYESRQESTQEALDELLALLARNEQRKREQAEKGFDGLTYFVYRTLLEPSSAMRKEQQRKSRPPSSRIRTGQRARPGCASCANM